MPKTTMPKEVLIYAYDYEADGTPILSVAKNVNEIPTDCDGEKVGNYTLNKVSTLKVKRELE